MRGGGDGGFLSSSKLQDLLSHRVYEIDGGLFFFCGLPAAPLEVYQISQKGVEEKGKREKSKKQ